MVDNKAKQQDFISPDNAFKKVKWSLRKKIMIMYIIGGLVFLIAGMANLKEMRKGDVKHDILVSIAREYVKGDKLKIVDKIDKESLKRRKISQILTYLILFLIMPGVLVLAYIVTNVMFCKPIDELMETARKIGEGEVNKRAYIPRTDEFGLLAKAFNDMTENLQKTIEYQKIQINKILAPVDAISTGNLTKTCDIRSDDEFGLLSHAINRSIKAIKILVSQIDSSSAKLSLSAAEILAATREQATGVTEQASQISQIASSLQELSTTAKQISESAHNVLLSAEKATKVAISGDNAVNNSIEAMHKINNTVQSTAKKISVLGESSRKIGKITIAISDIAEQTNLLALNAAIEAARAGEQGRGFAVVADEIRKLAERTSLQLNDINEIISTIQNETNSTVMAMEEGIKSVDEGEKLIHAAGNSLKEIIETIKETASLAKEITISTDEQTRGNEQLFYAMTNLSQVVKESELISKRNESLAHELNTLANNLKQAISFFKIS